MMIIVCVSYSAVTSFAPRRYAILIDPNQLFIAITQSMAETEGEKWKIIKFYC